jgi:Ca2+-binding EF-hand superfamily protein
MDKEEAQAFVKDSLGMMSGGGDEFKFSEKEMEEFFLELDADGSGSVDKEEMYRFVKQVCGLPVDPIVKKSARALEKEHDDRKKTREEEERQFRLEASKATVENICPMTAKMQEI